MALITGITEMNVKYADVYNIIATNYDSNAEFSHGQIEKDNYKPYAMIAFRYRDSYMIISVVRQKLLVEGDTLGDSEYTNIRVTDKEGGLELLTELLSIFEGVIVHSDYNYEFIGKTKEYKISDNVKKRIQIEKALSPNMDNLSKVFVASEIVKNKDEIMKLLQDC